MILRTRPGIRNLLWMVPGAVLMMILMLLALHFQDGQSPAARLAAKNRRLEVIARMQLDLASASEAEKSAVLAVTDEDSQRFADQARAAAEAVEGEQGELSELLASAGSQSEKESLAQFAQAFAEFRRIDKDLLALAVQNTNLKASGLAFGPAAAAIKDMDVALARITAADPKLTGPADNARIAAWRLLAILPAHIAEESDPRMDEMESQMSKEDQSVRQSLDELVGNPTLENNPDLKVAEASYGRFSEMKAQILKLSRENTNVRSLSISLNQKRKTMIVCQAILAALEQAIRAEPVPGITSGTARPR